MPLSQSDLKDDVTVVVVVVEGVVGVVAMIYDRAICGGRLSIVTLLGAQVVNSEQIHWVLPYAFRRQQWA